MSDASKLEISDHLDREQFLNALENNIEVLAKVPTNLLATPRVIAVDAQWGNGKTWIATEIARRLRGTPERPVVSIDVFRYDHHDDPFAVIAAAIYEALKPSAAVKKRFLAAAGAVLKSAAPVAAKAALTLGARAIGLSNDDTSELTKDIVEGVKDGAASFSEKAVEKLFESYSATERIQNNFMAMLSELTSELQHPLVVLVDELDRCRPSFALEVLERIKHLFGAENIVFVLFWNSQSIHESIRHTYGQGTDAPNYLAKFVAFSVPLELGALPSSKIGARFEPFVRAISAIHFGAVDSYHFRLSMAEACGILKPSLRQIQKSIQLAAQIKLLEGDHWPGISAYLLLLRTIDDKRFRELISLNPLAAQREAQIFEDALRYATADDIGQMRSIVLYLADKDRFDGLVKSIQKDATTFDKCPDVDKWVIENTDHGRSLARFQKNGSVIFRSLVAR